MSPSHSGWRDAACALPSVEQVKRDKHTITSMSHGFDVIPFNLSAFGSLGPEAEELLSYICQPYSSHAHIPKWAPHACVLRRLSFVVMRGIAKKLVGLQLVDSLVRTSTLFVTRLCARCVVPCCYY